MKISYLITCKNETKTLSKLLYKIGVNKPDYVEIIIIDDFSDNPETVRILKEMDSPCQGWRVYQHDLNNDYGSHKNFGNSKCDGTWIFQIDSDELPSDSILGDNLLSIIESNPNVELIYVPRINDFKGVTEEHAKQWGWKLDTSSTYGRPRINFPDFQGRIYRNIPDRIKWDRKLHEKIEGHTEYSFLPAEEEYALYHDKTIEKQIETNMRYNQIFTTDENRGHKIT